MSTNMTRFRPAVWIIIFGFLVIAVGGRWPNWWEWIAPEAAPARELSMLLLLTVSVLSLHRWWVDGNIRWLVVGAGFFVLAADERLALHERLRDRVLAPRDVALPFVPWGQPGDVVLVVVALAGLAALPLILPLFNNQPALRSWFAAGVVLSAIAVGLDTLPIENYSLRAEIWLQTSEEVIELLGAGAFVCALLSASRLSADPGDAPSHGHEVAGSARVNG